MSSTPLEVVIAAPAPTLRPRPLDRLPGSRDQDPFLRLTYRTRSATPTPGRRGATTATAAASDRSPSYRLAGALTGDGSAT